MRQELDSGVDTSACPDAEILAAFAEQALSPAETSQCENHVAACSRCRGIVALLAMSDEAIPADSLGLVTTESPQAAGGSAVALQSDRRERVPRIVVSRRRRWMVPALGAAAAVALWFALRPAWLTTPIQTIAQAPAVTSDAPPAESQIARSDLPRQSVPAAPEYRSAQPAPAPEEAAQRPPAAPGEPASGSIAADFSRAVTQVPGNASVTAESEAADRLSAAAAPPATAVKRGEEAAAAPTRGAPLSSTRQVAALAVVPQALVLASPDQSALWRLGLAGKIEHSADRGRTWQQQASGVTADLTAGVAVSAQVAWVVGRRGTLLRTTDGNTWRQLSSPLGTAADWISVEVADALRASIASHDGQRFLTEDGGRTWTRQ
jgi:hypothetical protein